MISIIIPVYKEAENLSDLAAGIHSALGSEGYDYEIIFVDDNSNDGIDTLCSKLADVFNVKLIIREHEKGLSSAVIEGFRHARGNYVVVMDGDMSHPPTAIPEMISLLKQGKEDYIVGSRYIKGGSIDETWKLFRYLNSKAATFLAFGLTRIKDPMSGFFALNYKDLPDEQQLNPLGYKINLEIMVKGNFEKIKEIPIHFSQRKHGKSKLSFKEQILYLMHLICLYQYQYPRLGKFIQFAAVGFSGFLIDFLLYYFLQTIFNFEHLLARALSFWPAMSWNWALNRLITFKDRLKISKRIQWFQFSCSSLFSFCISWSLYYFTSQHIEFFSKNLMAAFIVGIMSASLFNFIISYYYTFPLAKKAGG